MDFDSLRITNDKNDELITLREIGPRIISFRPEGREKIIFQIIFGNQ
jgi:hypothetical protein